MILANVNYVKKIVFPLEILPWVALESALFHALISIGVWLIAYLILFGVPTSPYCVQTEISGESAAIEDGTNGKPGGRGKTE